MQRPNILHSHRVIRSRINTRTISTPQEIVRTMSRTRPIVRRINRTSYSRTQSHSNKQSVQNELSMFSSTNTSQYLLSRKHRLRSIRINRTTINITHIRVTTRRIRLLIHNPNTNHSPSRPYITTLSTTLNTQQLRIPRPSTHQRTNRTTFTAKPVSSVLQPPRTLPQRHIIRLTHTLTNRNNRRLTFNPTIRVQTKLQHNSVRLQHVKGKVTRRTPPTRDQSTQVPITTTGKFKSNDRSTNTNENANIRHH